MNERQKRFAEYYAQCGNAAESAKKAGYSDSYAEHRTDDMLRNVEISAYIKELTDKMADERILTAKERQALLSSIANDSNESTTDRIRAVDTLNKMTGEYLKKIEVSGTLHTEMTKLDDLIEQLQSDGG